MGICNSCESTSVVTAKVILHDGRLQEFSNPVRVSQVLEKNPNCFICSSDDMEFDSILSAIDEDDLLQLGELYFALPLSWLNIALGFEEMRGLVIKASQALKIDASGGFKDKLCGCRINKVDSDLLLPKKKVATSDSMTINGGFSGGDHRLGAAGSGGGLAVKRKRRASGRESGSGFTAKLTVILEEEEIE